MGKADRGDVHSGPLAAASGALLLVREGAPGGLALIATGSMLRTAVNIAKTTFPSAFVWSVPSLKPINAAQVQDICRQSRVLVTLEEHSIHGGLGSLIAEISSANAPRPVLRIGVPDRFSSHCGSYEYLLAEHGLDAASVQRRIEDFIAAL
jgi:transketolase